MSRRSSNDVNQIVALETALDKAEAERQQLQEERDQIARDYEWAWEQRQQAIDALREARAGYDEFYESGDKTRLLNAESLIRAALVKLGEKPQ